VAASPFHLSLCVPTQPSPVRLNVPEC
jgi:hypothetical protein